MLTGREWPELATCRNGDPDALFVVGAEQNIAKKICRGCPVKYECLADALDNRIEFGIWGGMTERERRALLRRHPSVASWRAVYEPEAEEQMHSFVRRQQVLEIAQSVGVAAVNPDVIPEIGSEAAPVAVEIVSPTVIAGLETADQNQFVYLPAA